MKEEGKKYVWEGAIPLQINLEESEVTTVPGPPPALLLAPRIGYLPLLYPLLKPHFSSYLPSLSSNNNNNSIWFDFNGLPLKWYIPTGVLFDLLCPSPQRPWNLTVHFSGYPTDLLIPCDGEDSVKWNFINSLKEADYIANGNCKNVMNMSQSDQVELWRSVMNCNLEAYLRASSKLKLGSFDDEFTLNMTGLLSEPRKPAGESTQTKTGKIPVRLYVNKVSEDYEDWEDVPTIDCWDKVSYLNRPIEVQREEGKLFTLHDALRALLPEFFGHNLVHAHSPISSSEGEQSALSKDDDCDTKREGGNEASCQPTDSLSANSCAGIKLVRIQGIEPRLEIPMGWVVKNLKHPEHYLHICVWIKC